VFLCGAAVRPRCGTAWHDLALGSRDRSGGLGTWVESMHELIRPGMISCLPTNRQALQTKGLIIGNPVFLNLIVAVHFVMAFIIGCHLLLKKMM